MKLDLNAMGSESLVAAKDFCISHQIDFAFLQSLHASGLIEITAIDNIHYIRLAELPQLEKALTLYLELDINVEGIETIIHLLNQQEQMQEQITALKNRLSFYENEE